MKAITFNYRCNVQARFLSMKSRKFEGMSIVELAQAFSERLAEKLDKKYITIYPTNKRRLF